MTEQTADTFELSPLQERLWLIEPDGPSSSVQARISLIGPLDADRLHAALRRAVERHEILRTRFVHRPGIRVPLQAVADELPPTWSIIDVSGLEPEAQTKRIAEIASGAIRAKQELTSGTPIDAILVALGEDRHVLLLTLSGLCADSSCAALLAGELQHHYTGVGSIVEDPLQYADFSAWQRELQSDEAQAAGPRSFWSEAGGAVPTIPFVKAATGTERAPAPAEVRLQADSSALTQAAARYGVAAASVAEAAWHVAISRSSGEDEVTVALIGAPRRHADLEGAIGAFSRQVPIRSSVGPGVTFAELLLEIDHAAREASVLQDFAPPDAPRLPVAFVAADAYRAQDGELQCSLGDVTVTEPGLEVWLTCIAGEDELVLALGYDPALVASDTAERLARRVERVLAGVADDPGFEIAALELIGSSELELVLNTFNGSGEPVAGPPVHERFSSHAAGAPTRDAVVDEHGALSYEELERRSNQLAQRLHRSGVGPDVAVGLCTDRSVDMIVGLLGILKAGGAYVPLHYEHPQARLGHQLEAAGARVIVTQEPLLGRLPDSGGEVICLDRDRAELDRESPGTPTAEVSPENLAYVIFTSGSTGVPKGVEVTHGNLANYAAYITARLGADEEPLAFGVVTSISTDLGNTSVFGALSSGGTLVLVSPVAAADAGAFVRQTERSPIDVLKITPSHIGALLAGGDSRVLPRRWLVVGGERAPWDLVRRVGGMSSCRILNHYGPTEATVGCCTFEVTGETSDHEPATVPIGAPIAGTKCYVLDARRQPVALGAPGRLHVSGAGVARGYVGAPELTAERFIPDPFARSGEARMYDTGDLVRWLADGTLEFLGRVDEQIKIRGYRVEPAEVEAALRVHPAVTEAVVISRPGPAGDMRLVAYCAAAEGASREELSAHLEQWLPEFMVPSAIVVLPALPVTPSGKVDRLALPDPDERAHAADYVAARTPVEESLVEIWSHVLGVPKIGVQDDFFALGGHSLLATQVVAQVRSDFAIELPLHSLFSCPTVASLAEEVVRIMGESEDTASLVAELEGLSDEEAERLLAGEPPEA